MVSEDGLGISVAAVSTTSGESASVDCGWTHSECSPGAVEMPEI